MSPIHPTHEELVEHIESFARRHGHEETISIVGNGLEPILEDQIQMAHGVRQAQGEPCIARIVDDWSQCNHETGDTRTASPPHEPINSRDADLWLKDGQPVAYSLHSHGLNNAALADLLAFARQWDLEISIEPASYAEPNQAVHVLLTSEDA